jgi:hypothetical protein
MQFKYPLPRRLVDQALGLEEFANGAAQCHAQLVDGSVHPGILISNASAIIAMRGHAELPFVTEAITRLFQAGEDSRPANRGNWAFFDIW